MSVRIRLRRIGRKKQPSYRLVVADSATPRDGAYLDAVGFYNPRLQPAELRLDLDRVDRWLSRGADMSDTVASLVRMARKGGDAKVALKPMGGDARPAAAAVTVESTPEPVGAKAAAAPAAPPPDSAPPTNGTAEATAATPDASAETRRQAAAGAADPAEAEPRAGPAGTKPE